MEIKIMLPDENLVNRFQTKKYGGNMGFERLK